ncbi:MAG: YbfB/YjiJ family MFS transporter [Actinomycetia bacterium]|nr:YbfB/YjiJ family MFS transporter [Actinomycetes bacterium]
MTTVSRPVAIGATAGIGVAAIVVPLTTVVSHSFARSTYPILLPAMKDDILSSNTIAGIGGTIIYIAYLSGVVAVTLLSARLEPIEIMRTGLNVAAAGLLLTAIAPNTPLLMAGLLFSSAGGAGIWITAPVLATAQVPPHRRGLVIGLLTGSVGLGTSLVALGTRLARGVADNDGLWRPVFGVEAAVTLAILAIVAIKVRPGSTSRIGGGGINFQALRQLPGWAPVTLAYVCFGVVASGYASFLAEALETDVGVSRSTVSLIYVVMGISSLIGAPLMGSISDRFGRRTSMVGVLAALGVGSMVIALGSKPIVIAGVMLFGGMWSSYPTLTATYVRDHVDDRAFGSVYGTMTIFYGCASILPPLITGLIADALDSFTIPYLLVAGFSGAAALIALRIPDTNRSAPEPVG